MCLIKIYIEKLSKFEKKYFPLNFLLAEYHNLINPDENRIASEKKIISSNHENFDYKVYSFYKNISIPLKENNNEK